MLIIIFKSRLCNTMRIYGSFHFVTLFDFKKFTAFTGHTLLGKIFLRGFFVLLD